MSPPRRAVTDRVHDQLLTTDPGRLVLRYASRLRVAAEQHHHAAVTALSEAVCEAADAANGHSHGAALRHAEHILDTVAGDLPVETPLHTAVAAAYDSIQQAQTRFITDTTTYRVADDSR